MMLAEASSPLTVAGFIALVGLLLTFAALVGGVALKMSSISERVARLEERLERDERNGYGSPGKEP